MPFELIELGVQAVILAGVGTIIHQIRMLRRTQQATSRLIDAIEVRQ